MLWKEAQVRSAKKCALQGLSQVMECAHAFYPARILLRSLSVSPGLFPNLADLWQIISTSQFLGSGCHRCFPGYNSVHGRLSVLGTLGQAVWRASSSLALRRKSDGRSNLLAPSAVAELDTPQDSLP